MWRHGDVTGRASYRKLEQRLTAQNQFRRGNSPESRLKENKTCR